MAFGNLALGSGAIGAVRSLDSIIPPNIQPVPDPIPGATTQYTTRIPRVSILGMLSLGGGTAWPAYPTGGLSVMPMPSTGVVHGQAWWPDCVNPAVTRVHQDGSVHAVRGAFPLDASTQPTRRNYATNPSLEGGAATGYVAGTGAPTLTITTRPDFTGPRNHVLKATIAAAGVDEVTIPQSCPIASQEPFGADVLLSATPTGAMTVTWGFADASGASAGTVSTTVAVADVLACVGQYHRISTLTAPPVTAVAVTTVKLAVAGMPAGGYFCLDRVAMPGPSTLDTTHGDGATLGGTWTGTPELSISLVSPVLVFDDGEAPLDQLITYRVSCMSVLGGTAEAPPIELDSDGTTWATHPSDPGHPRRLIVKDAAPSIVRPANEGVFQPIGRRNPVIVTSAARQGMTGTLVWGALSFDERDDWDSLLADLQPMLFRMPAEYRYPSGGVWWSLGDSTEDPMGLGPQQDLRVFSAPFTEVDQPPILGE
jgi:hypothetical protein